MGKVFKIKSDKKGFVVGLLGGLFIPILLFLILPFTQQSTGSNPKSLLLKVDVTLPTPPPPPPPPLPPLELEEEEEKIELEEEHELLTLNQLELALNPGLGGVGIYSNLNPNVGPDAIAEMKIFDLSEVDRQPRALVKIPPKYPLKLIRNRIKGRVDLWVVIDNLGRITDYKVKSSTHLSFTKEVTRVIKKWKFTPALKEGKPVTVRKIQPFLFGEQ
jgi:protein TonB